MKRQTSSAVIEFLNCRTSSPSATKAWTRSETNPLQNVITKRARCLDSILRETRTIWSRRILRMVCTPSLFCMNTKQSLEPRYCTTRRRVRTDYQAESRARRRARPTAAWEERATRGVWSITSAVENSAASSWNTVIWRYVGDGSK